MFHDALMSARAPAEDDDSGGRWATAEHEGKLILFFPSELREAVKTSMGVSDAVACRVVVDLDAQTVYHNALIFGAALVPNIAGGVAAESPVLGRLTKTSRGAWMLAPHDETELHTALKWIEENNA